MKTRVAMAAVLTLLVAPVAVAQTTPGQDRAVKSEMSDGKTFALAAASSDMFEVESSKAALEKAERADVKAFAEHMIHEHSTTTAKLLAAAKADGIGTVSPPDSKYGQMIKTIQQAKGGDFNLIYARMQVMAHEQAVALFGDYAENGTSPQLKAFAAENLPILEKHLSDAKKLVAE
jgi:putative membrane protein